jgi:cell division protein FtsA
VPPGCSSIRSFAYLEHCEPRRTRALMIGTDGYFSRMGRWLREGF